MAPIYTAGILVIAVVAIIGGIVYQKHQKRSIISERSKETFRHGIIGGTIAVVLSTLEIARNTWLPGLLNLSTPVPPEFLVFVAGAATFVIAFALINLAELWWSRQQKVIVPDVNGHVDGWWVYQTRDMGNGEDGGTVMRIDSSAGTFKLRGHHYLRKNLSQVSVDPNGYFSGHGHLSDNGSIHYSYTGGQFGTNMPLYDHGVGYCQFWMNNDESIRLYGSYTGRDQRDPERPRSRLIIDGYRVSNKKKIDVHEMNSLLQDYFQKHPEARETESRIPEIGVVDGLWVEAIIENDMINMGSLITIRSSFGFGRFEVEGWSYVWPDMQRMYEADPNLQNLKWQGYFNGEGIISKYFDGFYYVFRGVESEPGIGTGYFAFWSDGQDLCFKGAFMHGAADECRRVRGKRISGLTERENKGQALTADSKKRLKEYLDDMSAQLGRSGTHAE
jgi:hypothetical protein